MERKWEIVLAFTAGIIIGVNWPKIKQATKPIVRKMGETSIDVCSSMIRFFAEQKERLEDQKAQRKIALAAVSSSKK